MFVLNTKFLFSKDWISFQLLTNLITLILSPPFNVPAR